MKTTYNILLVLVAASSILATGAFAQGNFQNDNQSCAFDLAQDTSVYVQLMVQREFGVASNPLAQDRNDSLAHTAIETVIQSPDLDIGKAVASYCQNKGQTCVFDIAQDASVYVQLIVQRELGVASTPLAQDRNDTLAYAAIETVIQSPDLDIGKAVASYCAQ